MKPLSKTYKELGIAFTFPIEINDAKGNEIYYENSDDYWCRYERDANGTETYYEDSNDYWCRSEYDAKGRKTYYENSGGLKRGTPKSAKTCEGKVVEVNKLMNTLKRADGTLLKSTDLLAILSGMKGYIESAERTIDGEWGSGRDFDEIHKAGEVTDTYDMICEILSENH